MLRRTILLGLSLLGLAACGWPGAAQPQAPAARGPHTIASESRLLDSGTGAPQVGERAPDFEYRLADGSAHRLSDLRGKKVLINFWATWCDPCRAEMPDLQQISTEQSEDLAILGINKIEQAAQIPPFADELAITFPLIANPSGDISERYAAQNIPPSYFINRDGTIGLRQIGVMNYAFIKTQLDRLQ